MSEASFVSHVLRIASDSTGGYKLTLHIPEIENIEPITRLMRKNVQVALVELPE